MRSDEEAVQRLMRRLATIASVGTEMIAPSVLGIMLDLWLKTIPWLTIILTVLGLCLGIYRLVQLNQPPRDS